MLTKKLIIIPPKFLYNTFTKGGTIGIPLLLNLWKVSNPCPNP